jgi:hypothetical protein
VAWIVRVGKIVAEGEVPATDVTLHETGSSSICVGLPQSLLLPSPESSGKPLEMLMSQAIQPPGIQNADEVGRSLNDFRELSGTAWDYRKFWGQAAIAIGGYGSLAGWNFCPKPEPRVPL